MNKKERVELLYKGYLENIKNSPFKIDFIKVRDIANELFFEGLAHDIGYGDSFLEDVSLTNVKFGEELVNYGTYWLYVVVEDDLISKYRVVDAGHRTAALKLLSLEKKEILDFEICAVIVERKLLSRYVATKYES